MGDNNSSGDGIGKFLSPLGLVGGLIGGIGKLFARGKANRDLRDLQKQDPVYDTGRLNLARTLLNARMPGASSAERNIYGNQANQVANINRNATDSSQALALGAGTQGVTNQAFEQLGDQENQDYQRRYGNVVNEENNKYQDQVRRYGDKAQILGAQNENRQNSWTEVSNMGFGLADYGLAANNKGVGTWDTGNGNGTSYMKRKWY